MNRTTDLQWNVLRTIKDYIREYEYSPTLRETARLCGASAPGVREAVLALRDKGFLTFLPASSRTTKLTPAGLSALESRS